ncbi:NRT2 ribosyltransferase, partial [Sakesphorus luctuosus]|nr:NRT2 ribosyltransferase [Sakesphorus luctuosus]
PTMELLPLLLMLLAGTLATGIEEMALDMAPNSFDDQYRDCSEQMLKKLPVLNSFEFVSNSLYAQAWAEAAATWHKPLGSLRRREQAIALLAYTMAHRHLYREFNRAVREGGRSREDYLNNFHFKVMHFLLTEALGDLRKSHPACLDVYRGITGIRFSAKPGQIIRFGQFTSTSLKEEEAKRFGTDTFFKVHTCHGAMIQDFSFQPQQEEVLIPPFETFRVTSVAHLSDTTLIQLRSHG